MNSFLLLLSSLLVSACIGYDFDATEAATKADYVATRIDIRVCVKDESTKESIYSSTLSLTSWSDGQPTTTPVSSDGFGCFDLLAIPRGPVLITAQASDYYDSHAPVDLHVPTSTTNVVLDDIVMTKKRDGVARLVFGGDVMFDRRFFDKDILHPGPTLEQETKALFQYIQPYLEAGDHSNVNLECPIVQDRSTPHPTKAIVFGCYRESAQALPDVGIDSVTVANNHFYDYLEIGINDTMNILDEVGMPWFGGGKTRQEARDSRYRVDVSGTGVGDSVPLSLQGFTNYYDYASGDAYTTFADDSPVLKGGAMPSFSSELEKFIEGESGRIAIPIIHGTKEYTTMQDSGMRADFETSGVAGAKLIIAHHPHTVHGISTFESKSGEPVFVVGSLGNLVFDQDFHETFFSYLAVVDMNSAGVVERLELVPIILEGYIPRPVTAGQSGSSGLAKAVRRIAHFSTQEALRGVAASEGCGTAEGSSVWVKRCKFGGAVPYLENNKLMVVASENDVTAIDTTTTHSVTSSTPILAVHEHHSEPSSLARLEASVSTSCELGIDLLRGVGGFELETAGEHGPADYPVSNLWRTSDHRYIQTTRTRTGTGGAVLLRKSTYSSRTSLYYDRRVNVIPGSKVTVRGFYAMENAGKFVAAVYVTDASGTTRYVSGMAFIHLGGDVPEWTEFNLDLDIPADIVEIKTYFRQYPPAAGGEGRVFLDDISYIQWDSETVSLESGEAVDLVTPNGWEYVRCSEQSSVDLSVTGRVYETPTTQSRRLRGSR